MPDTTTGIKSEADSILHRKEFGLPLKLARVQQGMSIEEVVAHLRLTGSIIHALEKSSVEDLPALTFTRGYIRSYAKLLGLSATDLVSDYMKTLPLCQSELAQGSKVSIDTSYDSRVAKFASSVIAIGLLLLLMQWLLGTNGSVTQETSRLVDAGQSSIQPVEVVETSVDITDQEVLIVSDADPSKQKVALDIPKDKPVGENTQQASGNDFNLDNMITLTPPAVTEALQQELKLFSVSESWVEIDDRSGNSLYYGLMKKNEAVILEGEAPFNVFLGNAPEVSVLVNDIPVDLSLYVRLNKIAHFQLGITNGLVQLDAPKIVAVQENNFSSSRIDEADLEQENQ